MTVYALIDADMVLYHALCSAETEVQWDDDMWTRFTPLKQARSNYWNTVAELAELGGFTLADCWHCFTSRSQFRRDLYPNYKANRKGPKPMGFAALKGEILASEQAFMYDQIEADDVIGLLNDQLRELGAETIIVSSDKDMRQLPGTHLNLKGEIDTVGPFESIRTFYTQALMGDSTDGIPGCAGIGKVRAERIVRSMNLDNPVECWETIVDTYGDADYALLMARLVRILRKDEYDFTAHTVNLWQPPTLTGS